MHQVEVDIPTTGVGFRDGRRRLYAFLRQLHGLPRGHTPNLRASPVTEAAARRRLSLFATLAGNDFADFKNIGALSGRPKWLSNWSNQILARIVVEDSKEEETPAALEEAEEKLRRSHNMFHNAVVWDPLNTLSPVLRLRWPSPKTQVGVVGIVYVLPAPVPPNIPQLRVVSQG